MQRTPRLRLGCMPDVSGAGSLIRDVRCFGHMSTPGGYSRLDDSVLEFVDRLAAARTVYGWGWGEGHDDRTDSVPVDMPPSFQFRVAEFFDWNQERRGGIGRIEQGTGANRAEPLGLALEFLVCSCQDSGRSAR